MSKSFNENQCTDCIDPRICYLKDDPEDECDCSRTARDKKMQYYVFR